MVRSVGFRGRVRIPDTPGAQTSAAPLSATACSYRRPSPVLALRPGLRSAGSRNYSHCNPNRPGCAGRTAQSQIPKPGPVGTTGDARRRARRNQGHFVWVNLHFLPRDCGTIIRRCEFHNYLLPNLVAATALICAAHSSYARDSRYLHRYSRLRNSSLVVTTARSSENGSAERNVGVMMNRPWEPM